MKNNKFKKMSLEEILSIIASIPVNSPCIFGFGATTEKKQGGKGVLEKSRITGLPVPERFQKITTIFKGTVSMSGKYQDMVNADLARQGVENPDFQAKPTYCAPVSDNRLLFQHKHSEQLYFRVNFNYGATMTSELIHLDAFDAEIPAEEYKAVKEEYLKKDSVPSSGATFDVRNYKVENVTWVNRGEVWLDKPKGENDDDSENK